jgi:hypothetical protein
MLNRRTPLLIFEALLVLGLLLGSVSIFRDPGMPHIGSVVGIVVNLFLQALLIMALRNQKREQYFTPENRRKILDRQRAITRILFAGSCALFVLLAVNMSLSFFAHAYSIRIFATIALVTVGLIVIFSS